MTACLILYQKRTPQCELLLEQAVDSAVAYCDSVHVLDNTDDKLPYTEARKALLSLSNDSVVRFLDYDDYLLGRIPQTSEVMVAGAECNRRAMLSKTVEAGLFNRTIQTSCVQWDRDVAESVLQHTDRIWEYWSVHEALSQGCNVEVYPYLASVYRSRWSQVQLTARRQETREHFLKFYHQVAEHYPDCFTRDVALYERYASYCDFRPSA